MLMLADGTFFPLVADAGLAPETLQERECSCKGFFSQDLPACGVLVSTGIGNVPAGLDGATRT
jgi:hypothetical protein